MGSLQAAYNTTGLAVATGRAGAHEMPLAQPGKCKYGGGPGLGARGGVGR